MFFAAKHVTYKIRTTNVSEDGMQVLTQSQFQTAFALGAVQSVELEPVGSQFAVRIVTPTGAATLVQARKAEPRLFGTVDSALKLLHKLGVRRIVLERLERWHPNQPALARRSRPDRAEVLNRAADYDRWVQGKVQASRDDPRPAMTDAEWQRVRAEKQAARSHITAA